MWTAFVLLLAEEATAPLVKTAPNATQAATAASEDCQPKDAHDIVVCAPRRQGYRLDPSVVDANREAQSNSRSATSAMPAAQASCAASPMGCGKGLEGLDLANVAVVAGTMAVRAAKGDDWLKAFKVGGVDEYELYKQAKQRRESQETERAAAAVKKKAQEAERQALVAKR